MKRTIVLAGTLLLALFSSISFAQGMSLTYAAKIIPAQLAGLVSPSGWVELDDTPQYRLWVTTVQPARPESGVIVTLKEADKGIDGSVIGLHLASFNTICGSDGSAPNYAQEGISGSFDEHGWIDGSAGGPEIRIIPGTNLALAVKRACAMRHPSRPLQPIAESGHCSAPNAEYPIQAMRMNQQGVVIVGLTVTADRHARNLSVESSSGSSALDNSALAAVSQAVCNAPLGTHISLPVKFSLQH